MTDDVFDAHIARALAPVSGELSPAADVLATIRSRTRRRAHGHIALVAVAVVVVAVVGVSGLALASALGLFRTVPTHINVTQPGASGGPPVQGIKIGQPYTTSLQHAQAIAGYQLLTLSAGTVESVTAVPPATRSNGQPLSPTEVLKPSFQIEYVVDGTSVQLVEDPVTPGSSLQLSVKWYGAPNTHQATVDGFNVIWQGINANSVDTVAFQTTSGTLLYMTSGPGATTGPAPGLGNELSLNGYVELIEGMS
jgi:hypothetical protein